MREEHETLIKGIKRHLIIAFNSKDKEIELINKISDRPIITVSKKDFDFEKVFTIINRLQEINENLNNFKVDTKKVLKVCNELINIRLTVEIRNKETSKNTLNTIIAIMKECIYNMEVVEEIS